MALTPEEEAELRRLEAELAAEDDADQGTQAVSRSLSHRRPQPPTQKRPFSLYRATVGSLKDAAQGLIDTATDFGQFSYRNPAQLLSLTASPAALAFATIGAGASQRLGDEEGRVKLPALEGEEDAGTAERVVRGIGSFLVPYAGWAKAAGVARGASWLGRAGRATVAGAAVDFTQVDPVSGNMANFLRDTFGLKSEMLDTLAGEDDDEALYNRFKAAAVGAPIGIAADALFETGFQALKAYRAWKGTADEAEEIVKGLRKEVPVESVKRSRSGTEASDTLDIAADVPARANSSVRKTPQASDSPEVAAQAPRDMEDVLDYLKRQAGAQGDSPEELARIIDATLSDNAENALARLGVDPSMLDFSKFDDPDVLGRFLSNLSDFYEGASAAKLGRTNIRVTERATLSAARTFATTSDILKDVHGATANLAEYLTGARLFVGAHANKLLSQADLAIKEISETGPGPAWASFLETFHRHAYYLGTVRGAGSEVGRALRSLQIVAKTDKVAAAKTLGEALEKTAGDQRVLPNAASKIEEGASNFADRLVTDAEKIEALSRLKQLGGDVGELSRHVRTENMGLLRRVDGALKETVGNLFSVGTATYNVLSGSAMLGSKALSKALASVGRMALSPLGARQSMQARINLMDTWAYVDGMLGGFREATEATLKVLEREGMAEAQLTLDSLGLAKLATKAAKRSADAEAALKGGNFERADVKSYRNFAITPSAQLALNKRIEEMPGPVFFQEGLKAVGRVLSTGTNALGSLSRLGTILFINLPDQFMGTLAARAGAYSKGVRLAASEAAELGLEGKELTAYLKARTVQLAGDTPVGTADDAFEAGQRQAMAAHGDAEAREVLFQDDLELGINRTIAQGIGNTPLLHLVVPFIKTPLRILERTAIDNTPLGLLKGRIRNAILAGGPEGDEALARMTLGTLAVMTAYQLAEDRTIVGQDGGYGSSARLSRGSYTLRIGDDQFEFNRIDPLGSLLGFGADINAYFRDLEDDPEAPGNVMAATEAFFWATTANILSKTWLTSLRNLTDLAGATSDEDFSIRMSKFVAGFATRFVPASGVQRQIDKAGDGFLHEAFTFSDTMLKASIGASTLPVRRDRLLGRPMPLEGWDRIIGVRAGPGADAGSDPLAAELEALSFDLPAPRRSIEGVKLNAQQFSRWLELKGQVTRNEATGLTLEETLTELIKLPEYQALSRQGKVKAMREELKGFSRLATDQLLREDNDFAFRMLRRETFEQTFLRGGDREEADAETRRLAAELGITPSN